MITTALYKTGDNIYIDAKQSSIFQIANQSAPELLSVIPEEAVEKRQVVLHCNVATKWSAKDKCLVRP